MSNIRIEDEVKKLESVLASKIFESSHIDGPCRFSSMENEMGEVFYQGRVSFNLFDKVNVFFSIPVIGDSVFITASDGDESELSEIIANADELNRKIDVKLGNVQLFKSEKFNNHGHVGVIFLPIDTSNVLSFLPKEFEIDDKKYKFILLVFLSNEEHKIWTENGNDALMDYFAEVGKDLITY